MQFILNNFYSFLSLCELTGITCVCAVLTYFSHISDLSTTLKSFILSNIVANWFNIIELSISNSSIVTKSLFLPSSLTLLFQTLFSVILMIWARAAGPRFRLDQIFTMTWKDYFITLSLITIFLILIYFMF